jgi:hypothetical protein
VSIFLAAISCKRDQRNGCNQWFREQLGNSPIPYKIFLGNGCEPKHEDEIVLSVDDGYQLLPGKVQAVLRWVLALPENYSHILKTDCDCRVWPTRLLKFDFEPYDYIGDFADGKEPPLRNSTYAMGGGYILSRAAAEKVITASPEKVVEPHNYPPHDLSYAEDEFVGRVLNRTHRLHSEQFQSQMAGRGIGSTDNLIVFGNAWSTDRGRR